MALYRPRQGTEVSQWAWPGYDFSVDVDFEASGVFAVSSVLASCHRRNRCLVQPILSLAAECEVVENSRDRFNSVYGTLDSW